MNKAELLKAMEDYFGKDTRRIEHAKKVTYYAEEIFKKEKGDHEVVIAAAIFHDIGIHAAEKKYGSATGHHQEKEGPPIARHLFEQLNNKSRRDGIDSDKIDEVCAIIGNHHSPGKINSLNFKIVYDADWLVNLKDEYDCQDKKKLSRIIEKVFLTKTGKEIAKKIYL